MSKKDKLISKLKSRTKSFSYDEAVNLLESLGLKKSNKGKTSGSKVTFVQDKIKISLHRPHPQKELKPYQIADLLCKLEKEGLI